MDRSWTLHLAWVAIKTAFREKPKSKERHWGRQNDAKNTYRKGGLRTVQHHSTMSSIIHLIHFHVVYKCNKKGTPVDWCWPPGPDLLDPEEIRGHNRLTFIDMKHLDLTWPRYHLTTQLPGELMESWSMWGQYSHTHMRTKRGLAVKDSCENTTSDCEEWNKS